MMSGYYTYFESPVGPLCLQGNGVELTGLHLSNHRHWEGLSESWVRAETPFAAVLEQLDEYFSGHRQGFDLPLCASGTQFQQGVWRELQKIPFGETISYAELAKRVGQVTASRAVGNANGKNPISIIIPCHRVIATNGKLTGYAGGVEHKKWLLEWEQAQVKMVSPGFHGQSPTRTENAL